MNCYEKYKKMIFYTCTGNTNMVEYSLRNSRMKMVYHQMRLQPHLARMVERGYHTIQTWSAIHTCLLYVIFFVFTTIMFCVFSILSVDL